MSSNHSLTSISESTLNVEIDHSIFSLIASADLVGKLVFILLAIFSVWSWAIIISKYLNLKKTQYEMYVFEEEFWKKNGIQELSQLAQSLTNNPLAKLVSEVLKECKATNTQKNDSLKNAYKDRIICIMNMIKDQQVSFMEQRMSFLATIGSSSPFIGLFGTVWGIMHSFQSIAYAKNTTLAVVAPGIAEALLATAIGLFAAIPATIFYNYFTNQIIFLENKITNFSSNLYIIMSKAIDKEEL